MERIELVELVREKADVGYTDAKEALDACGDDLLDALVWLEAQGRSQTRTAHVTTAAPSEGISGEMYAAQAGYARSSQSGLRVLTRWLGSVRDAIVRAIRRGMDTKVVSRRGGDRPLTLPLLGTVLGTAAWLMLVPQALQGYYHVWGNLTPLILAFPVAWFFYLVFACRIERPDAESSPVSRAVSAPAPAVPPRPMTTPAPPAAPATPAAPAADGPSEEGASCAADEPEVDMEEAERADPDDVAGPADEDSDHD
ncbi:hypothetical protein [Thermophilibacter provencensis]|uniref:Uncharacterized protein n=1 Tax=Thermophilibacter provencensis TaxID=1852386 RepID=A0A921GGV6_9ACTN|nr:hypothetical protein [Thermophilibacter provencensis]HJF46092.1 hypothetical protein [Thermophilibacter provencensis]